MNWDEFGRKPSWPKQDTTPAFAGRHYRTGRRIRVLTKHFSNKILEWWFQNVITWLLQISFIFFYLAQQPPPPPKWAMASSFTRFLDHTQRCTTVGRTPLDEWSARCRDLYLTTHNTHNRQTSMPPVVFEPTISAGERPQTCALDRAATGTGYKFRSC